MARSKSDSLGGLGVWFEIAKVITAETFALDGTEEDIRRIISDKQLAKDFAKLLIAARPGATSEPVKPARPPLVGRVVKTITIPAYESSSFAEAVRLGKFDNDTIDIVHQFADERVGLAKPTKVELVEFDRDWWNDEALAWGIENGNKKPIETVHIMGIAIKLPNEQRERPIVVGGSVRRGGVLCLDGSSHWRSLDRDSVKDDWDRSCLFGFLSE